MTALTWIDEQLANLQQGQLRRNLPQPLGRQGAVVQVDDQTLVNFASNDYLGLAGDARLANAAAAACHDEGVGRGASPLICGRSHYHDRLERRLAEFEGTEAALLFTSGFAANAGVIPAVAGGCDAIYSDAKNHASIVDGCRLSQADVHVYPHGDCDALATMLQRSSSYRRRLIVTDSLFSMDGDLAPIRDLARLAENHDAMLMVDEAHATGVLGRQGRGVVEWLESAEAEATLPADGTHDRLHDKVHIRVGTLSKALGSAGGFVCGSANLIEWLANRARSYVFSTAHPPASSAAALAALDVVRDEPQRRTQLAAASQALRRSLRDAGWNTGLSQSHIVPILIGSPQRALDISARLRRLGFWAPTIRPPSVPPGESLLRITLTAAHTPEMVSGLLDALGEAN